MRSPQPGHFYRLRSRPCTGARRLPWFAWANATGGSLTASFALVSLRSAAPCRLPIASHGANPASWRGDLAARPALESSNCATLRPDPAKFGSGSGLSFLEGPRYGALEALPRNRCSSAWPCGVFGAPLGSVFGSHLVGFATVALLLLLQLACCRHYAQHQGPN